MIKFFSFFFFYPPPQSNFSIESLRSPLFHQILDFKEFEKKKNSLPKNFFHLYLVNLKKRRRMWKYSVDTSGMTMEGSSTNWRERGQGEASFNEPPVFAYVSLAIFNCEWTATCSQPVSSTMENEEYRSYRLEQLNHHSGDRIVSFQRNKRKGGGKKEVVVQHRESSFIVPVISSTVASRYQALIERNECSQIVVDLFEAFFFLLFV